MKSCFVDSFGSYAQLIGFSAGVCGTMALYLEPESINETKALQSLFCASIALALTGLVSVRLLSVRQFCKSLI